MADVSPGPPWQISDMKPLQLILGFLPLIAFSLLARLLPSHDFGVAALLSAGVAVIAMAAHRPIWPPMLLTAASLIIFIVLAIVGFTAGAHTDRWAATWLAPAFAVIIGLIILVLIPVMPFTEQYARQSTPQQYWSSPTFKRINHVLSAAWGAAPSRSASPASWPRSSRTAPATTPFLNWCSARSYRSRSSSTC